MSAPVRLICAADRIGQGFQCGRCGPGPLRLRVPTGCRGNREAGTVGFLDFGRRARPLRQQVRAEETAARRAAKRALGAQSRQRQEDRYRHELEDAIVRFLAFAPAHQGLEQRIAKETAAHAAVVGSGRVGRTRKLTLDDRAALSVRAYIRHCFTSYHGDLDALLPEQWDEEYLYREIKGTANEAVDRFLFEHRRSSSVP